MCFESLKKVERVVFRVVECSCGYSKESQSAELRAALHPHPLTRTHTQHTPAHVC